MAWELLPTGERRCAEHSETFARTRPCPGAASGCGQTTAIAEVTTDKELQLLEDELRTEAKFYRRTARELMAGTGLEQSLGLKSADVSLKFDRAAMELLRARKDREHDRWLVEENRKLQGSGVAH